MMTSHGSVAGVLAEHLRDNAENLTRRWLDRIQERVAVEPERIFPSADLIDHIPVLITGLADYVENPQDDITADVPVVAKAMELGALRHEQGFPIRQILWEYEILGGVIFTFLSQVEMPPDAGPGDVMHAARRVFRAIAVMERSTTLHYLQKSSQVADEREQRLRGFGRALSHELKNALSVVMGASAMLHEEFVRSEPEKVHQFALLIRRNAGHMRETMENLVEFARIEGDARRERNVLVPHVVEEVARQLRDFADAHGVRVHIEAGAPDVEVHASSVELGLSNLLSNAIKYHDPRKAERWVRIAAWLDDGTEDPAEVVIEVRDNGRGIPEGARDHLFDRFYRVDDRDGVEGTGLGLSLVRDAVRAIGGHVWCEVEDGETAFRIALPARRAEDSSGDPDPRVSEGAGLRGR